MIAFRHRCCQFSGLFLMVFTLVACSAPSELSISQKEFQNYINNGFTAPQIVTVDLPASARAHLYLDTPEVKFVDSRRTVEWVIPGEVDVDFAGQISSGRMSMVLQGSAGLDVRADEQSVFLNNVTITGKDISVQSNFVQMLVLDALAEIVAGRLNNLLLFTVPEGSPLAELMAAQAKWGVGYQIEPGRIVFTGKG